MPHPPSSGLRNAAQATLPSRRSGRRRPWTPIILSLFLLLLGSGCLRRNVPDTITLTWWITFAADSDEFSAFQAIADAYEQDTGHEVELVPVPWNNIAPRGLAETRLSIAQAAGEGPDVWGPVPHSWSGAFAKKGQAVPLVPAQIESSTQYDSAALDACRFEGQQVGLPVLADSLALLYNKALVGEPPASFESLISMAAELTDSKQDQWGLAMPLLSPVHTFPFIDSYGGYIQSCSEGSCDLNDIGLNNQGAVQGIALLSNLYLKDKLFAPDLADRAVMTQRARELFIEGHAAMLIDSTAIIHSLNQTDLAYGVVPLPILPGALHAPRPLVVLQAVYASTSSPHPEEAIELLNHIASADSALALVEVWHQVPVRRDALRTSQIQDDPILRAWREQIEDGVPLPSYPELDYVWSPWGQALEKAIPGLVPVQEAMDQAVQQIKSVLETE